MIYTLFGIISILLVIAIVIYNRDMTAPAFLLVVSFWIAGLCACMYAKEWDFYNYKLVLIVTTGLISFIICSWISYMLYKKGRKNLKKEIEIISLSNAKLVIYLIFQISLYVISLVLMIRSIGLQNGISTLIGSYYEMNKTGEQIYVSSLVSIGTILNFSGIYYVMYIAINNIIAGEKNKKLLYINILIGVFGSLLNGTKSAFYMFIIGAFVMSVAQMSKKNGWKRNINLKSVIRACSIVAILLISFSIINTAQGRALNNVKVVDILATYLGSPLKNLELYINENHSKSRLFGEQTFLNIYSDIYEQTGNGLYKIDSIYKYRWINGNGLGNVYTIFTPLYHDFGVVGSVCIMGMMGFFTQHIYNKLKYRKKNPVIDFYMIFYSYLAFAVMFSFFSNKFFECIVSKSVIYFLIGLWMFDLFFLRLHIKAGKVVIKINRG